MTIFSTITLGDAANVVWGAVVVGAGPAGSIAARELSRLGVRTLLVDKSSFPRSKVCGCCLNGSALAALDSVGLGELPKRLGGISLESVRLAAGRRSATLRLPGGASLSREAFDAELIKEAMNAGAAFLPGTTAKRTQDEPKIQSSSLRLRQGDVESSIETRVVINAGGLNGRLDTSDEHVMSKLSRIGAGVVLTEADEFFQPGTIYMAVGRGGYVGLVRLEDDRLDIAAAFDPEFVRRAGGLGLAAASIINESGFPAIEEMIDAPWRGTPALTRTAKNLAGERWFAVGDAAGYVEPFTGEGMAWAMASGAAVAPLAAEASKGWKPSFVRTWESTYARIIRSRQGTCRAAAAVLRSPWMSKLAVRALSIAPVFSRPIVAALNRPSPVRLEPTA